MTRNWGSTWNPVYGRLRLILCRDVVGVVVQDASKDNQNRANQEAYTEDYPSSDNWFLQTEVRINT